MENAMRNGAICRDKSRWGLIALIATITLAAAFFAFPQQASAAKTKTCYLPTKVVEVIDSNDPSSDHVYKNTYNKYGLLRRIHVDIADDEPYKVVYTRNKKGLVTGWKQYDDEGKNTYYAKSTIKNGKVKKIREYRVKDGKLWHTITFTYKKGKVYKSVEKRSGVTEKTFYYTNGNRKRVVYKYDDGDVVTSTVSKFNKKDLVTSYQIHWYSRSEPEWEKSSYKYKYTYNKKGDPQKISETVTYDSYLENEETGDYEMSSSSDAYTIDVMYHYNKRGDIARRTKVRKHDEISSKNYSVNVVKYTYKKFKVPKKYWSLLKSYVPGSFNSQRELMWEHNLP